MAYIAKRDIDSPTDILQNWLQITGSIQDIQTQRRDMDLKRHDRVYRGVGKSTLAGFQFMAKAKNEKGHITDRDMYNKGLKQVLSGYDKINNNYDFVEGSINFGEQNIDRRTIDVKDHRTGKTTTIDLPSEQQIKQELKNYFNFEPNSKQPFMNTEGWKNYLTYGLANDQAIREWNDEQWANAKKYTDEKGNVLLQAKQRDFRGTGEARTKYRDPSKSDEMLTSEQGSALVTKGGYQTAEEREAEGKAKYQEVAIRKAESGITAQQLDIEGKRRGVKDELVAKSEIEARKSIEKLLGYDVDYDFISGTASKGEGQFKEEVVLNAEQQAFVDEALQGHNTRKDLISKGAFKDYQKVKDKAAKIAPKVKTAGLPVTSIESAPTASVEEGPSEHGSFIRGAQETVESAQAGVKKAAAGFGKAARETLFPTTEEAYAKRQELIRKGLIRP